MSKQTSRYGTNDPRKISYELFTLTYGSFVAQLIKDYENCEEVLLKNHITKINRLIEIKIWF